MTPEKPTVQGRPDRKSGTAPLAAIVTFLRKSGALRPWTAPLGTGELPHVPVSELSRYASRSWVLRFRDQISMEIIFDPGRRLGANLDAVIADMHRLIRHNSDLHPGGSTHRQLVDLGYCLCVLRKEGKNVGFAASCRLKDVNGRPVLFLGSACVDRSVKSRNWLYWLNFMPILSLLWRHPWRGIYLTGRTSSPRVLGFLGNAYDMYPRPMHETPAELLDVAASSVEALTPGAAYDREGMILRGIRPPDPGFQPPDRHHDRLINQYCDDLLDYQAGDAFVVASRLRLSKTLRSAWIYWRKSWRR